MKLIRFGAINDEKPGVITSDGARRDISAFGSDYDETFFGGNDSSKVTKLKE